MSIEPAPMLLFTRKYLINLPYIFMDKSHATIFEVLIEYVPDHYIYSLSKCFDKHSSIVLVRSLIISFFVDSIAEQISF